MMDRRVMMIVLNVLDKLGPVDESTLHVKTVVEFKRLRERGLAQKHTKGWVLSIAGGDLLVKLVAEEVEKMK